MLVTAVQMNEMTGVRRQILTHVLVARCIHLRSNGGVGFHPDPTTRGVLGPTQGGTKSGATDS